MVIFLINIGIYVVEMVFFSSHTDSKEKEGVAGGVRQSRAISVGV